MDKASDITVIKLFTTNKNAREVAEELRLYAKANVRQVPLKKKIQYPWAASGKAISFRNRIAIKRSYRMY